MTATLPAVAAKKEQAEQSAEQQAAVELVRLAGRAARQRPTRTFIDNVLSRVYGSQYLDCPICWYFTKCKLLLNRRTVPVVVVSLFAGVWLDRRCRRSAAGASDAGSSMFRAADNLGINECGFFSR